MKTKYIKGTKEKYTITEDGVITVCKTNKTLKEDKQGIVSFYSHIKNKYVRRSVRKLIWLNHNIFFCIHCQKKSKERHDCKGKSGYTCMKCGRARVLVNYLKWRDKNPEIAALSNGSKALTDAYIHRSLYVKNKSLPKELVQAKRDQLKLFRELKKQKTNDNNSQ